jgi:hypothetical protein
MTSTIELSCIILLKSIGVIRDNLAGTITVGIKHKRAQKTIEEGFI